MSSIRETGRPCHLIYSICCYYTRPSATLFSDIHMRHSSYNIFLETLLSRNYHELPYRFLHRHTDTYLAHTMTKQWLIEASLCKQQAMLFLSWQAVFIIDIRPSVLSDIYIYVCWSSLTNNPENFSNIWHENKISCICYRIIYHHITIILCVMFSLYVSMYP